MEALEHDLFCCYVEISYQGYGASKYSRRGSSPKGQNGETPDKVGPSFVAARLISAGSIFGFRRCGIASMEPVSCIHMTTWSCLPYQTDLTTVIQRSRGDVKQPTFRLSRVALTGILWVPRCLDEAVIRNPCRNKGTFAEAYIADLDATPGLT
ncbi:hypothetical protein VTN77DRAFT_7333 [Rasamsonia byssochlamydoides]|uniref:uncharacterized protein n=1 Tax=Rasamsonia byssochlamydoides TaxID=89139 RepID=UPI0037448556